jgi:hypothetical protein
MRMDEFEDQKMEEQQLSEQIKVIILKSNRLQHEK